jgi:hypothetical protein
LKGLSVEKHEKISRYAPNDNFSIKQVVQQAEIRLPNNLFPIRLCGHSDQWIAFARRAMAPEGRNLFFL